ncbi:MAG: PQQ-binding-like beta-propeller repeat protein [Verrucomicrobiota bacterium]
MKLQCPCGAKYSFETSPVMAYRPVQFICPACGLDSSEFVNQLIRQELGPAPALGPEPDAALPEPAPAPVAAGDESTPAPAPVVRQVKRVQPAEPSTGNTVRVQQCSRHPGQVAAEKCRVCQKPICPQCMELFGYVCSPLCKSKAEAQGIDIPAFAGTRAARTLQFGRKLRLAVLGLCALVAALLGGWGWYAWRASHLTVNYSVRFDYSAESGKAAFCDTNQIVFLHGDVLARHDTKTGEAIWSRQLIDRKKLSEELEQLRKIEGNDLFRFKPDPDKSDLDTLLDEESAALGLRVVGRNIWVLTEERVVRYNWDTGKPDKEIAFAKPYAPLVPVGNELLTLQPGPEGQQSILHIDLASGETKQEIIPGTTAAAKSRPPPVPKPAPRTNPGPKPLDPARVAEMVGNMSYPARIALPATLGNEWMNERISAELEDPEPAAAPRTPSKEPAMIALIPTETGYVEFSRRMLEARYTERKAMKDAPSKTSIDGELTVSKTAEAANEILNEIQRSRGGDTITENNSLYEVGIRCPGDKDAPPWTGQVSGPPDIFLLKTVRVIAAGKSITVLDHHNRKLWQAELSNRLPEGMRYYRATGTAGEGLCAEHGGALYVADQAMLTAFDLQTGKVRWRLPSVGTEGLFFDDRGNLYVNTTTASPESVKFSNQIDINRNDRPVIFKVDPANGRVLWSTTLSGYVQYVSGPYLYTVQSHRASARELEDSIYRVGPTKTSFVTITRLNPATGKPLWVHSQPRGPLDVRFDKNRVEIVFRKEVQVLSTLVL